MALQNQVKKSKKGIVTLLIIVGVIVLAVILGGVINASNQAAKQAAYKSQLNELTGATSTFQTLYNQYFNAPSSTTRTKTDWDTYYTGVSTQVQTLTTTSSTLTYADTRLMKVQQDLTKGLSDFSSLITLAQSNIDMQFQISSDQSLITSDTSISQEEAGFPSGYVAANKTRLDTDNASLAKDQQTYKDQTTELGTLGTAMGNDDVTLRADITAAQPAS